MKKLMQGCLLISLLALAACQSPEPAMLSDADREAIEATTEAFVEAIQEQDWAALAATYTEDAVLMPPNHPTIEGRDDIAEYFGGFPPLSDFSIDYADVEGCGDMAYVRGTYSMTIDMGEGEEEITDTGKYLEIRKRQADGSWLLYLDIFNSDIATGQ